MSALNKKGTGRVVSKSRPGTSYNGNPQVLKEDAHQLYELAVMWLMGKDSFYESNDARWKRVEALVDSVVADNQLDFIANTIIHARHVMNIRSMPIALTVLFAKSLRKQNKSYPYMRILVRDVIARVDQITDMYAVALGVFGSKNKIPLAIKRGVADAFNSFNEYQFAKYNTSSGVKLRDVLRIVHPKGSDEAQGELFKKIMTDALETPYTWETELSRNGQLHESERKEKSVLWAELVTSGKLGYMALLRNLRNIKEANVGMEAMDIVYDRLADPEQVRKSKQLPFRFINALDSVQQLNDNKLNRALSRAVDASLGNLPQIGKNVWIIIDCSGSMNGMWGSRSGTAPIKTACLFAAALAKANAEADNVRVTMFSENAKHISVNTDEPVLTITNKLMGEVYGGGTNLRAALNLKSRLGFEPDTVVVLSDMQVNHLGSQNVSGLFEKDCVKVAINLEAYDSTPLDEKLGWYQLSGWSERLFDFIPAMRDKQSVVQKLSTSYRSPEVK